MPLGPHLFNHGEPVELFVHLKAADHGPFDDKRAATLRLRLPGGKAVAVAGEVDFYAPEHQVLAAAAALLEELSLHESLPSRQQLEEMWRGYLRTRVDAF